MTGATGHTRGVQTCGIVVAAGTGERFGAPKQFLSLRGALVAHRAVAATGSVCEAVVVVVPEGHTWAGPAVLATVVGGVTRSASVRAGLAAVPDATEVVVVHDAARPLASPTLFRDVIDAVDGDTAAAVPAVPIHDTVKRVEGDEVRETVDRAGLVTVQTPQAFRADVLRRAHDAAGDATDDAALVEALGHTVRVVPGDPRNLKLTTTVDMELAMSLVGDER